MFDAGGAAPVAFAAFEVSWRVRSHAVRVHCPLSPALNDLILALQVKEIALSRFTDAKAVVCFRGNDGANLATKCGIISLTATALSIPLAPITVGSSKLEYIAVRRFKDSAAQFNYAILCYVKATETENSFSKGIECRELHRNGDALSLGPASPISKKAARQISITTPDVNTAVICYKTEMGQCTTVRRSLYNSQAIVVKNKVAVSRRSWY